MIYEPTVDSTLAEPERKRTASMIGPVPAVTPETYRKVYDDHKVVAAVLIVFNCAMMVTLWTVFGIYGSQLAFASACDSLMDVLVSSVLAFTMTVGRRVADEDHHFGHTRAEPIGALIAAVFAATLAVEVERSAIETIVGNHTAAPVWPVFGAFCAKAGGKLILLIVAKIILCRQHRPALDALAVDSRNDVIVNSVNIVGWIVAKYANFPAIDGYLAIPAGLWIGWAGFQLGRENVRLLMGEAPPEERQKELVSCILSVPEVNCVESLRVHHLGPVMQLEAAICVEGSYSIVKGSKISEKVRELLEKEEDICSAIIRVGCCDDTHTRPFNDLQLSMRSGPLCRVPSKLKLLSAPDSPRSAETESPRAADPESPRKRRSSLNEDDDEPPAIEIEQTTV